MKFFRSRTDRFVLGNVWFSPNFYPRPRGWARPDGIIGMNGITGKYPWESELVTSLLPLKIAFPYLDLMIALTDWDECPQYVWDAMENDAADAALDREDYPDFAEHIVYSIWFHGDTMELMAPDRAREKYQEYNHLYGGPNEDIFKQNYYEDNNLHPANFEYLKRCIRSHGLDPEEVLAKYEWGAEGLAYRRE